MLEVQLLVTALLHTLWQGPAIALGLSVVLAALPARQANLRYAAAVAALAAFVGVFFITWNMPDSVGHAALSPSPEYRADAAGLPLTAGSATTSAMAATPIANHLAEKASYYELALGCWLAGVALMLVRLVLALKAVRGLAHAAFTPEDAPLNIMFEELRASLRAPARAVLRLSRDVLAPVALGLFPPMVILPAAFATGLSPGQLRAILAHELAHLRRHDYFVNLLQMLAEAAFYFNPALWWISRQIRIEREACCDFAASAQSGGHMAYSEALAEVARLASANGVPAAAMAMPPQAQGGLAERVRRLLAPAQPPHLRLPLPTFAIALAATLLLLFATYATAQVAARAVVSYLSLNDEERIEYLASKEAQSPNYSPDDDQKVEISGRLVLPDGAELPTRNCDVTFVGHGRHSFCQTVCISKSGNFGGTVRLGPTYVQVTLDGFEPVNAGPFHPNSESRIEGIEIALVKATPARLLLRDEDNNPVRGAKVSGHHKFFKDLGCGGVGPLESDTHGVVLLDQAAEPVPVDLSIEAPGYQQARVERLVAPAGADTVIRLKKDIPMEVLLRKQADGSAIEAADFYLLRTANHQLSPDEPYPTEHLGDGRYVLRGLDRQAESVFAVRAPTVGGTFFRLLPPSNSEPLTVRVPELFVRGKIRGDVDSLKNSEGKIMIGYRSDSRQDEFQGAYLQYEQGDIPVEVIDGVGHFTLTGLLPGYLYLALSEEKFEIINVKARMDDVLIELEKKRDVVVAEKTFTLITPKGMPLANGYLTLNDYLMPRPDAMGMVRIPIKDGTGSGNVPCGSPLAMSFEGISGYGLPRDPNRPFGQPVYIVPMLGSGPEHLTFRLQPTGAISGTVSSANGVPLSNEWVFLSLKAMQPANGEGFISLQTDEKGSFTFPSLPFDQAFLVKMQHRGEDYTQEVSLSATNPVAEVKFTTPAIAPQRAVTVRLVDPKGEPVRNYRVKASAGLGGLHHCKSPSGVQDLSKVDAGVPVQIHVAPERGFQPASVEIGPDQTEVTITVQPGHTARGQVVDNATGQPRPDITVFIAFDNGISTGTVTDSAGNFEFTNLPETPVKAYIDVGKSFGVDLVSEPAPLTLDGTTILRTSE